MSVLVYYGERKWFEIKAIFGKFSYLKCFWAVVSDTSRSCFGSAIQAYAELIFYSSRSKGHRIFQPNQACFSVTCIRPKQCSCFINRWQLLSLFSFANICVYSLYSSPILILSNICSSSWSSACHCATSYNHVLGGPTICVSVCLSVHICMIVITLEKLCALVQEFFLGLLIRKLYLWCSCFYPKVSSPFLSGAILENSIYPCRFCVSY